MSGPNLSFLQPQERKTVGLLLAAAALLYVGYAAHNLIAPAEAAQSGRLDKMAADVAQLNVNMARVMDRLGITAQPELPPVRTSGVR